jgi:preprotein translocase SecE subunit
MITSTKNYVNEAMQELRHVRWPTRQQAVRLSIIVLIFTLLSSAAFGFVDFVLSQVVKGLLSISFY